MYVWMGIDVMINASLSSAWLVQNAQMVNVSLISHLMDALQHLAQKIITVLMEIDVLIDASPFYAQ